MLTIEQLSQKTKNKIIMILNQDGVDRDSVQACVMGIACENLGVEDTVTKVSIERFKDISTEFRRYNREYSEQVLIIYGNYVADETLAMLFAASGIDPTEPVALEIQEKRKKILADTVRDFLPRVALEYIN